jgi:hypothetical protein
MNFNRMVIKHESKGTCNDVFVYIKIESSHNTAVLAYAALCLYFCSIDYMFRPIQLGHPQDYNCKCEGIVDYYL